jgi:hypothetical protein
MVEQFVRDGMISSQRRGQLGAMVDPIWAYGLFEAAMDHRGALSWFR